MNYETFIKKTQDFPVFSDLSQKQQLARWVKAGKVIRLKRGLYTFPENKCKVPFSLRWLANTLYSPSYLSLEFVLSYYDLIPERVPLLTSITPLKTKVFQNPMGHFVYRNLKKSLFFGFEEIPDEFGHSILMANPEKALLDFIYLYPHWENTPGFMRQNLRLQQISQLKPKYLKELSEKFRSRKISTALELILQEIKNEPKRKSPGRN